MSVNEDHHRITPDATDSLRREAVSAKCKIMVSTKQSTSANPTAGELLR
jgi:hypothetical protein